MKNFEDVLERHLQAAADATPARRGDVAAIIARGRRRQFTRKVAVAVSAAAVVVLGIGITASLLTGTTDDSEVLEGSTTTTLSTTTEAPSVPATTIESAVIIPTESGLVVTDGSQQVEIGGDLYFERVLSVMSDGRNGLALVHEVTPLPWSQGSIVWLAAGADRPEVLVPGPDTGPGGVLTQRTLIGLGIDGILYADRMFTADGTLLEVFTAGFDGSTASPVVSIEEPVGSGPIGDVAGGGKLVAIVRNAECPTVEVYTSDGQRATTLFGDCRFASIHDIEMSPTGDGLLLVLASGGDFTDSVLVLVDTSTGETLSEMPASVWGVGWRSADEVVVVDDEGAGVLDLSSGEIRHYQQSASGIAVGAGAVTVARGATHGSGTGELPCEPVPLPDVIMEGVPEDVLATWLQLRQLAASCDITTLAEWATNEGTSFTFGGESDLARAWVRSARLGYDYREQLLAVTALKPATLDTESGAIWVWPAVAATGADADWQELIDGGFLTPEQVESMKEFGGYLDYRVGIRDNGSWAFAIAGD